MRPGNVAGPGDSVAPFTLPPYRGGKPVSWQPGAITVLSFCALWCDTWREQNRRLITVRQRLAGLPLQYLTISVDGRWAERFANGESTTATMDVLLDNGGQVSGSLGLRAVPWTLVVDYQGIIQFARQGIVRTEELESVLRRLATTAPLALTDSPAPLYLTFDDFPTLPSPGSALSPDEELLDTLRATGISATFFCIGEHLMHPAGAAIAQRAVREGHRLQMHSWDHSAQRPELTRCAEALRKITGVSPTFYRPPGSTELRLADGTTLASPRRTTAAVYDHQRPGVAELTRRILFAARPGVILQLHAGVSDTRTVLPNVITTLRRRGVTFATL